MDGRRVRGWCSLVCRAGICSRHPLGLWWMGERLFAVYEKDGILRRTLNQPVSLNDTSMMSWVI